jgi:ATP-dependent DNA ligase
MRGSAHHIFELKIDGFRALAHIDWKRSRILYLDHVEGDGRLLFEQIVRMDLEGIVCKRKDSPYKVTDKPSRHWIKVKNSRYSQLEGREELFERV